MDVKQSTGSSLTCNEPVHVVLSTLLKTQNRGFSESRRRRIGQERSQSYPERLVLSEVQNQAPGMYHDLAVESLEQGEREYLGNLLYFSNEGMKAMDQAREAVRRYAQLVQYGRPSNRMDEVKAKAADMDGKLWERYGLLRSELKEPATGA